MNLRGRTLRARVVRSTALVSALAMAAMIGTVVLVLSAVSRNSLDARLEDQLVAVSATLSTGPGGALRELRTPDDVIDDTTWVFDATGHQVEGPRVSPARQAIAESLARVRSRTTLTHGDRVFLAARVRTVGTHPDAAVVVVAASSTPYEETRTAVVLGLSALGILVTIGSAAIAAWTLRRALAPVEAMADLAEDWSQHDLEARFDDGLGGDEIAHLGNTLNVLLDRVAGALRSEQRLTSELAHELRTPLTAIRGEAELGRMITTEEATGERLDSIVSLVDRMTTTIGTLVDLARGHATTGARTGVPELVAAALSSRGPDPRLSPEVDGGDGVYVSAPLELAGRALSPLLDNALDHADSSVRLSVSVQDRVVHLTVSDDGAGIATDDRESLFSAGHRGSDSAGAGLGLALARRVARTLGGDVRVTSAQAPTSFTLTLPRY